MKVSSENTRQWSSEELGLKTDTQNKETTFSCLRRRCDVSCDVTSGDTLMQTPSVCTASFLFYPASLDLKSHKNDAEITSLQMFCVSFIIEPGNNPDLLTVQLLWEVLWDKTVKILSLDVKMSVI